MKTNMKKILLAGIAVGALASTGASAAILQAPLRVSGIQLPIIAAGTSTTQRITIVSDLPVSQYGKLATRSDSEADQNSNLLTSTNRTNSANTVTFALSGTNPSFFTPAELATAGETKAIRLRVDLSGSGAPKWKNALTSAQILPIWNNSIAPQTVGNCTLGTPAVIGGGTPSTNFIEVNLTVTNAVVNGCSSANSLNAFSLINSGIALSNPGSATISGAFTLQADGTQIDGGSVSGDLVAAVGAYDVTVTSANLLPTAFSFASGNTQLLTGNASYDNIIGTVRAGYTTGSTFSVGASSLNSLTTPATLVPSTTQTLFLALNAESLPQITPTVSIVAKTGTYQAITPAIGGVTLTANAGRTAFTGTGASSSTGLAATNITLATVAGNAVIQSTPTLSTVTLQAVPVGALLPASPAVVVDVEAVGLQGSVFVAPWFGGSKASAPSVLRLSSSTATGNIKLNLLAPKYATGDTPGAVSCSLNEGVKANDEYVIDAAKVTTCFGPFVRGDLQVILESGGEAISAKMRVANANGTISELSLGRIAAGVSVAN